MKLGLVLALLAPAMAAGCDKLATRAEKENELSATEERARATRLKRACASQQTYASLPTHRSFAWRHPSPPAAIPRSTSPLNITVCEGRFILELPPGSSDVFDGDQRLQAKGEYSALEAADGSGLVYQMKGAEPIVYRLAALDLNSPRPAPGAQVARAEPPVPMPTYTGLSTAVAPHTVASPAPSRPSPGAKVPSPEALAWAEAAPSPASTTTRPSFNCR